MSPNQFNIYQCLNSDCAFRFPARQDWSQRNVCPKCGADLKIVELEHPAQRVKLPDEPVDGPVVEALLDNIRSSFNVGSMFRAADGAGLRHIHLSGISSTPDNPKISKTALGAEYAIPWTQYSDGLIAVNMLKNKGYRMWALEGGERSLPLFSLVRELSGPPILLAVGNEVSGVDPGILNQCERIISIPMEGYKRSLNVSVAFGIAVYFLRFGMQIGQNWERIYLGE
jgi:23S rRNA (guanosine2251-2'-O)-methyltransferase